jgi:hypothetical protein
MKQLLPLLLFGTIVGITSDARADHWHHGDCGLPRYTPGRAYSGGGVVYEVRNYDGSFTREYRSRSARPVFYGAPVRGYQGEDFCRPAARAYVRKPSWWISFGF